MKKLMFGRLFINVTFAFALVAAAFPGAASAFSGSGTGAGGDPYQITNCTQLQEMNDDLAGNYVIMNDIDCSATSGWNSGSGFLPIMGGDCEDPFTGTLDGGGHTITGLFVNHQTSYGGCAGLFGWVDGAILSDLSLEDVDVTAIGDYAAGLVGYAENGTTIANVTVTGTVSGQYDLGGLVGYFDTGTITNSGSAVTITGDGTSSLGGLVGEFDGTISNSYATGDIISGYEYVGGLVGASYGSISNSYAMGDVNGEDFIGGLAGWSGGTIANSYSVGSVTGDSTFGGLVGQNDGTVTASFWDIEESGLALSSGGTGKTRDQMKNSSTFTNAGWDFTTDWDINGTDNQGYPFFRWQTFVAPTDGDGVSDVVENASPNGGDANNDGTPDKDQATVTSLVDPVTNKYAVLDTTGCSANNNVSIAAEDSSHTDATYNYPAGLMDFTLTCTSGATATITMYYYGLTSSNVVLRKYNATTHAYTTVTGAVVSSVTIGGQQATKIVYHVADGGPLDQDGTVNGTIVDPAGPAVLVAGAPNTGVLRSSLLPAFMSIGFGLSLAAWTRRRAVQK